VVRQTKYEYLRVIGVVCPETGRAEGLLSPRLNVAVINVFMAEFSESLPEDEHAVMIWDGAGFHTGKKVVVPDNVTLMVFTPYCPELNPIESPCQTQSAECAPRWNICPRRIDMPPKIQYPGTCSAVVAGRGCVAEMNATDSDASCWPTPWRQVCVPEKVVRRRWKGPPFR
jgi:hypothetical protein